MGCSDSRASVPSHFVSFARRLLPRASVFVSPAKPDAGLGPGVLGSGHPRAACRCRGGDGRASQVPGEPWCAYALFSDPGGTAAAGRYAASAWPPHIQRRRLPARGNFGAQSHGLGTGCLRFARWVAPADARLASGCWPGSTRRESHPQGSCERFPRCVRYIWFFAKIVSHGAV
jgi:hypothetical protein